MYFITVPIISLYFCVYVVTAVLFSPILYCELIKKDEICFHISQVIDIFSEEDRKAMQTLFSYKP